MDRDSMNEIEHFLRSTKNILPYFDGVNGRTKDPIISLLHLVCVYIACLILLFFAPSQKDESSLYKKI